MIVISNTARLDDPLVCPFIHLLGHPRGAGNGVESKPWFLNLANVDISSQVSEPWVSAALYESDGWCNLSVGTCTLSSVLYEHLLR